MIPVTASTDVTKRITRYSNIPPMNDYLFSNPNMYCNAAREDPLVEKCFYCTRTDCKHAGTQTVFVERM